MLDFLKSIKSNILITALLYMILGLVLVLYPDTSLTSVCAAVGFIVVFTGAGFLIGYFTGGMISWFGKIYLILGAIFVLLGAFLLSNPRGLVSLVPVICGLLLIYHGIENMRQAWELRGYGADRWWSPFLIAVVTIVLGIVVIKNPFGTMEMLMRIVGFCLIYDGLSNLVILKKFSKSIRNYRKQKEQEVYEEQEIIEGEYKEL